MIDVRQLTQAVQSFDAVVQGLTKSAFVPSAPPAGGQPMPPQGQGMPMDPNAAAMQGAPAPMPGDPSMGGMPAGAPQGMPMDPGMGAPIDPNTGAPMDPSMMQGAAPQGDPNAGQAPQQGGNAPLPAELMEKLQQLASSTGSMAENFDALQKQTDQLGAQQLSMAERIDKLEALLNGPAPYAGSSTPANPAEKEGTEGADLPLK